MLQRNVESGPKQITSISCIFLANQCYLIFDSGAYKVVHFQQESAANVQESAAAQLRLWRECMRRYETVARDVGDTDARLMVSTVSLVMIAGTKCKKKIQSSSMAYISLKHRNLHVLDFFLNHVTMSKSGEGHKAVNST